MSEMPIQDSFLSCLFPKHVHKLCYIPVGMCMFTTSCRYTEQLGLFTNSTRGNAGNHSYIFLPAEGEVTVQLLKLLHSPKLRGFTDTRRL